MTAGFERCRINLDRQGQRDDRTNSRDGGQQLADRIGLVHRGELRFDLFEPSVEVFNFLAKQGEDLAALLDEIDVCAITPLDALNLLFALQKQRKEAKSLPRGGHYFRPLSGNFCKICGLKRQVDSRKEN